MERDLSSGTLENVPLNDERNSAMKPMTSIPTMGGTAIANPMAPAFPPSNSHCDSSANHPINYQIHEKEEISDQNRPNSLSYRPANSVVSHSYSAPNSLISPGIGPKCQGSTSGIGGIHLENKNPHQVMSPGSLTSPTSENGAAVMRPSNSKIENLKTWSISTYKCTKQLIAEKLGKSSKTIDSELEGQIQALRDTQRKYSQILRLSRALSSHFYHVVQTQHQLGDCFADLSQKSPELQEEFIYNSETQRTLTKNGEALLGALNFFVSSVNTLCNKTMEDTLLTIKQYEQSRIEFDAYRSDLETMTLQPRAEVSSIRLEEAQRMYQNQKTQYDQLRSDVSIKLKFLEENKVKVMHKQLLLFHNAISSYFSGNQKALEVTLKQFNIKPNSPNTSPPSWLEQTVPETFNSIFGSLQSPTK